MLSSLAFYLSNANSLIHYLYYKQRSFDFLFFFLFFMVENIAYYVLFEDTLWTREISKGSDQSDPQCFLRPQQCHSEEG